METYFYNDWPVMSEDPVIGLSKTLDVASAIISHEQTQSNRVYCFQTLDAVFLKDPFSDYFKINVVLSCHTVRKLYFVDPGI